MSPFKRSHQRLSLPALLQELQNRIDAETLAEHEPALMKLAMKILSTYAKDTALPLPVPDLSEIRGQAHVKRVLEVAAAGGHNLLLIGPPGSGKGTLARALPRLLRAPSESLPFREVHGASSSSHLFGAHDAPGEVTFAHGGVLLLRELGLCTQSVLATLAQTKETHIIAWGEMLWPARFQLIATLLPCPCGWRGDPARACNCSTHEIRAYVERLRESVQGCFDLQMEVALQTQELLFRFPEERSLEVYRRSGRARDLQASRYAESYLEVNADLGSIDLIQHYCLMDTPAETLLREAIRQLHLTPGQLLSIQSVARTIADLARREVIGALHLAEAIQYRPRL